MKCGAKSAVILGAATSHGVMLCGEQFPGPVRREEGESGRKTQQSFCSPLLGRGALCLWWAIVLPDGHLF